MINVDVYVPAMEQTYTFNLDEESEIAFLIDEIPELISKKQHSRLCGTKKYFIMGSADQRINFNPQYSLKDYSIKNGDTLILV